jgi:transcriptional regulator GlxA family with amidase domain
MPPATTASLRARLANYLDRPRRLGSICTGAFILAELGILDGLEATTHWIVCNRLKQENPDLHGRQWRPLFTLRHSTVLQNSD